MLCPVGKLALVPCIVSLPSFVENSDCSYRIIFRGLFTLLCRVSRLLCSLLCRSGIFLGLFRNVVLLLIRRHCSMIADYWTMRTSTVLGLRRTRLIQVVSSGNCKRCGGKKPTMSSQFPSFTIRQDMEHTMAGRCRSWAQ